MSEQPPAADGPEDNRTVSLNLDPGISVAIVRAIARVDGRSVEDLPALYEAIEPQSLERVLEGSLSEQSASKTTVTFQYAGYHVTVTAEGEMRLQPIEGSS